MYSNKNVDGTKNMCGKRIASLRMARKLSQRALASELQLLGMHVNKNTIQMIEAGTRYVTDIDLWYISQFFDVSVDLFVATKNEYKREFKAAKKVAEEQAKRDEENKDK